MRLTFWTTALAHQVRVTAPKDPERFERCSFVPGVDAQAWFCLHPQGEQRRPLTKQPARAFPNVVVWRPDPGQLPREHSVEPDE
jgi:hypothetical protein